MLLIFYNIIDLLIFISQAMRKTFPYIEKFFHTIRDQTPVLFSSSGPSQT